MGILDFPLFTRHAVDIDSICAATGTPFLLGGNIEDRSNRLQDKLRSCGARIINIDPGEDRNRIIIRDGGGESELSLRDRESLDSFIGNLGPEFNVDITGLDTNIIAPLTRSAWDCDSSFNAIYIEPASYSRSNTPTEGDIFDLSERIEGIAPIPSFSRIRPDDSQTCIFVPLLGFEGARLAHIIENIEPLDGTIYPIIGVPGFEMEYPFSTYLGNKNILTTTNAWTNARYSRANCPFSLFYCLEELRRSRPSAHMKIAPIGTKPHGLGAIIYCLSHPESTEIIYDFPIKSPNRTKGISSVSIFELSRFKEFIVNNDMSLKR